MSLNRRTSALLTAVLAVGCAAEAQAQDVDCEPSREATAIKQAEQKLVLLLRMVGDTGPAKRVDDGANEEAKGILAEAREQAARSGTLLDEGCAAESIELSTAGLSNASKAFSMARNRAPEGDRVYREIKQRTASFLQTLESQPAEDRGVGDADITGMRRQIERAEEMALNGNYQGAADLLKPVVDRLERRLAVIYDQQTVYYEKKFEGPADEYAYLQQQHRGYRMLFEQYAGDREPPHAAQQSYENYLSSAITLAEDAETQAEAGEWDAALENMRLAVRSYERAMRLVGIGY
jgi:hypothetical protein